jgi:hypothetical protein
MALLRPGDVRLKRTVALKVIAPWPDSSVKTDFDRYLQNGTYRLGLLHDERGRAHSGDLPGLRRDFKVLTTNLATVTKPLKRALGFSACF